MRLVREGVAAMSFHTRLDAVEGGVNDTLANAIGLRDVTPFGQDGEAIGRIGTLKAPMSVAEFAALVKRAIGAEGVQAVDAGKPVYRVAVLGGSGSDDVKAARAAGADTYLSGELKHNWLTDAPDLGINLVAAGHFLYRGSRLPHFARYDPECRSNGHSNGYKQQPRAGILKRRNSNDVRNF
jgi:putative NIF3 family GTP cyclohydrolase 1 type 2